MSVESQPIVVRGAREHNLKDVDLSIPRNQFVCFTGVSGSGKSSLAFDTLYAEGQRRYLESLSTYARQFVGQLPKPDVDFLSGLSPAISISQKSTGNNPRSTVGTITELTDFLRVLFARCGTGFCPVCNSEITSQTRDQMIERIMQLESAQPYLFLAPVVRAQKGTHRDLFDEWRKAGFNRARVNGTVYLLSEVPPLERYNKHDIELVVDRIQIDNSSRQRIAEAVDNALRFGEGTMLLAPMVPEIAVATTASSNQLSSVSVSAAVESKPKKRTTKAQVAAASSMHVELDAVETTHGADRKDVVFSQSYSCAKCGVSYPPPSPQLLSFNSPQGACKACEGLGISYVFAEDLMVTDATKSIKNGAMELIGKMTEMPKWMRRAITAFSSLLTYKFKAKKNLATVPWEKLPKEHRHALLHGHAGCVVFSGRTNSQTGEFTGIANELLDAYRQTTNPMFKVRFEKFMRVSPCEECHGTRLNAQARSVRMRSKAEKFKKNAWLAIGDCSRLPIGDCAEFFSQLDLTELQAIIGTEAIKEIRQRLQFLIDVGLSYLSLERTAPTLSGGESQRIRLASQIGAGLVGVLYVLDEPSIGLHPRDNQQLLASLQRLRDLGNTLIVVEHDEDTMRAADTIVDFGPGPGVRGGELIATGSLDDIANNPRSLTGQFLSRKTRIDCPEERRNGSGKSIQIVGARHNNLKNIDVEFPLGKLIAVTGVSGSGKSSLVTDILTPVLRNALNGAEDTPGLHKRIDGLEHLDKIIDIDQSPIGRTPRSNPATYVKLFDEIRDLFSELPESKRRGFTPGTFSFNTEQGRCTACDGHGATRLDMEFLADLWVPCPACEGKRYNRATLQVEFKGKSIADCLDLDVQQAIEHFEAIPKIFGKLKTLQEVGLEYLKLGQPSPTLSGGEAQRIKLSRELSKRSTGKTLYVLDEPTTGLHFHDINLLLRVLQSLVDRGNTVVVVEHNIDLIQAADWVIDLGPEGGEQGGKIVFEGTPEQVAGHKKSYTGIALKRYFESHGGMTKQSKKLDGKSSSKVDKSKKVAVRETSPALEDIQVFGARQHNLKNIDLTIPRNAMTVFCGHSGSGKTSMAMDTVYAEGQRRFVESLSPYVRQFVGQMPKPIVERVDGLSPAIAIEQRNLSHTPRSTVGTVTEIYDYFRVLFARLGQMHCSRCNQPVSTQTIDQIVDRILAFGKSATDSKDRALLLAPFIPNGNHAIEDYFAELQRQGFVRIRINGQTYEIDRIPALPKKGRLEIQIVVDRLQWSTIDRKRLTDSLSQALNIGNGVVQLAIVDDQRTEAHWDIETYSLQLACARCGISFEPLTPHSFSFNTAVGWCQDCQGLGVQTGTDPAQFVDESKSLLEGGFLLWPSLDIPLSRAMLHALSRETGMPIDRPIRELSSGHRTILYRGLPDQEIKVHNDDIEIAEKEIADLERGSNETRKGNKRSAAARSVAMVFRFQGVFPALENLSNAMPMVRFRLTQYLAEVVCTSCHGSRVRPEAAHCQFHKTTIADVVRTPIGQLLQICREWKLGKDEVKVAGELVREVTNRIQFLVDVGLEYLTLDRGANTLSGGESQRIRLASQLGSGLCGVLYVLDEPTIGLHPRDNLKLIQAMHRLRDLGNTLLVVEHDRDVIANSDQVCDFGPESGPLGGTVVSQGTPREVSQDKKSITGPYIQGKKGIEIPSRRQLKLAGNITSNDFNLTDFASSDTKWLTIRGAKANTLRGIDVSIPLGYLTTVTGPSGSGKSSLVNSILYPALARKLYRSAIQPGPHDALEGVQLINKVLRVDQSSLGNSPSSNPATYTGVFEHIRLFYAKLPEAKLRGLHSSHFSFNLLGGRCEKCEGIGQICIQMHFLPDVWITCDACHGRRYTEEVLSVKYRGQSIHDVLNMSIREARELLGELPRISDMLGVLCDVGLDYLALGQSAPTLSGGEAQRVKLAAELCRPATGSTLYLLDEPTTGLHFDDINKLMIVLDRLVSAGNTVVIIEHNLEVIRCADWVIDLGPEAGEDGGQIVFAGPPEFLVRYAEQYEEPKGTSKTSERVAPGHSTEKSKSNGRGRSKSKKLATEAVQESAITYSSETRHRSHTGEALAKLGL